MAIETPASNPFAQQQNSEGVIRVGNLDEGKGGQISGFWMSSASAFPLARALPLVRELLFE